MIERLERLEELIEQSILFSQQFNIEESISLMQDARDELEGILNELGEL